jgi:putative SOS response-associated peptidase YedK
MEFKMCGRYYVEMSDGELAEIAEKAKLKIQSDYREITLKASGEIFPTDTVAVMTGENEFEPMIWGFPVHAKLLINARYETYKLRPAFKYCRRCLIPASGYFEWKKDENPSGKYAFTTNTSPIFLAGIYRKDPDKELPSFVILTQDAVGIAAEIHDRMPVIIPREMTSSWLSGGFSIDFSITDVICERARLPEEQIRFDL